MQIAFLAMPVIEKVIMAVVIIICVIFLVIGMSTLFSGHTSVGTIFSLLGVGGIAGCIYWIKHPAAPDPLSIFGLDEDNIVSCGCNGGEYDGGDESDDGGESFDDNIVEMDSLASVAEMMGLDSKGASGMALLDLILAAEMNLSDNDKKDACEMVEAMIRGASGELKEKLEKLHQLLK